VDVTAKYRVDQYKVLFRYCSLGGDTAMPGWLHARLCHAFLVEIKFRQLELAPTTLATFFIAGRTSDVCK